MHDTERWKGYPKSSIWTIRDTCRTLKRKHERVSLDMNCWPVKRMCHLVSFFWTIVQTWAHCHRHSPLDPNHLSKWKETNIGVSKHWDHYRRLDWAKSGLEILKCTSIKNRRGSKDFKVHTVFTKDKLKLKSWDKKIELKKGWFPRYLKNSGSVGIPLSKI